MALQYALNYQIPAGPGTASSANLTKYTAWYLVEKLIGTTITTAFSPTPWVVDCSSDGSTASAPASGTDLWTTTFNPALIVQDVAGSAHSWFCIKTAAFTSPATLYVVVDCTQTTSFDLIVGSGTITAGTASARPTFTNEYKFTYETQNLDVNNGSITTNQYLHLVLDGTDANFYFSTSFTGSSTFYSYLFVEKLANTNSTDSHKVVAGFTGNGETGFSASGANPSIFNFTNYSRASRLRGMSFNGSASLNLVGSTFAAYDEATLVPLLKADGYATGQNDGGDYNSAPIVVFAKGTNGALKGVMQNITLASGALSDMTLRPSPSPYTAVKFGDCWVPWSGASGPIV